MSTLARTPESNAAWERLKRAAAIPQHERRWVRLEAGSGELELLLAGKSYLSLQSPLSPTTQSVETDMQDSPCLEKIEAFFKRGRELSELTLESLENSLQMLHDQDLCSADLRAAEEENRRREAENQMLIEYVRAKFISNARKRAEIERLQQQCAEYYRQLAARGIQVRRDRNGRIVCCCCHNE